MPPKQTKEPTLADVVTMLERMSADNNTKHTELKEHLKEELGNMHTAIAQKADCAEVAKLSAKFDCMSHRIAELEYMQRQMNAVVWCVGTGDGVRQPQLLADLRILGLEPDVLGAQARTAGKTGVVLNFRNAADRTALFKRAKQLRLTSGLRVKEDLSPHAEEVNRALVELKKRLVQEAFVATVKRLQLFVVHGGKLHKIHNPFALTIDQVLTQARSITQAAGAAAPQPTAAAATASGSGAAGAAAHPAANKRPDDPAHTPPKSKAHRRLAYGEDEDEHADD